MFLFVLAALGRFTTDSSGQDAIVPVCACFGGSHHPHVCILLMVLVRQCDTLFFMVIGIFRVNKNKHRKPFKNIKFVRFDYGILTSVVMFFSPEKKPTAIELRVCIESIPHITMISVAGILEVHSTP
jgi:hypothetical protein